MLLGIYIRIWHVFALFSGVVRKQMLFGIFQKLSALSLNV